MAELPVLYPFTPCEGDLPVRGRADVEAVLPDYADPTQPVTSAVVCTVEELHLEWQEAAAYAAAQSDPTRSTDTYLDVQAGDRGTHRQQGELDEPLRDRTFAAPAVVTPAAILAVVNQVLAPYTTVQAQIVDGILDGLFLSNDTGIWHSFLGNVDPDYPDRLYGQRIQAHPGSSWPIPDENGRYFLLRVPVLEGVGNVGAFCFNFADATDPSGNGNGAFLTSAGLAYIGPPGGPWAPNDPGFAYLTDVGTTALQVYQAIADAVSSIRGMGVRWFLLADPLLG